jgi:hypothetical protein
MPTLAEISANDHRGHVHNSRPSGFGLRRPGYTSELVAHLAAPLKLDRGGPDDQRDPRAMPQEHSGRTPLVIAPSPGGKERTADRLRCEVKAMPCAGH